MSQLDSHKAEEARQAQIMANAINQAIMMAGDQFETPILNAVCGALVTNIAEVLASISDARHRKAMRKAMDHSLSIALADALTKQRKPAEVVVIGGIRH